MPSDHDIKEYLESGILELYAAGALSLAETTEVDAMAARHPEVVAELSRISEALSTYALSVERNPRPSLRKTVMDKVQKNGAVSKEKSKKTNEEKVPASSALAYKYLLAAAMASLVISTFASYFFYNRWSETEDRNMALLTEKNVLSQNYTAVKTVFDRTYSEFLTMRDFNTKVITLAAVDSSKSLSARVYWNNLSHETFIDAQLLPVPDSGKKYQLWAMVGNSAVDAGIFEPNEDSGLNHMKSVFEAESWSVTVEPPAGSLQPTLANRILISKRPSF